MDDSVQENQLDEKQIDWLRDIKYRYFPQPQQEWSKENEETIDNLIDWTMQDEEELQIALDTLVKAGQFC